MRRAHKLLGLVLTATLAMGVLSGCSSESAEKSKEAGAEETLKSTLVMGFDEEFVPMGFKDTNGEHVGFDIDLAKEATKRMGVELELKPITWDFKETELKSGKIDLIWNGYTITDKRKEEVNFTDPYLDNAQAIITMKDSPIKTKADLEGKIVATQGESSGLEAINKSGMASKFKDGKPVEFAEYNSAFMDLEAGRVDAIVGDEIMAGYYIKKKGAEKYNILEENFGTEEYGVGVRKEDTLLLKKLNEALNSMKEDGTAGEISKKWFELDLIK